MFKRGGYIMSGTAPSTQVKPAAAKPCKRTCCWTPFGHKVDAPRTCKCHTEPGSLYV